MSETDDLTGAERYLAERLADPEYRDAYEAAAPAAGDDLRERIARAIYEEEHDGPWKNANHPDWVQSLRSADAVLAVLPAPPIDEGAGPSGPPWYLAQDVWMALGGTPDAFEAWAHCEDDRRTWGDAWAQIIAAVGGSRMEGDTNPPPGTILDLPSYQWVRESPAPPPAPPWPGAVLSGLTDEDGVPTWLAQAGQVRGEQVRFGPHGAWWLNRLTADPDNDSLRTGGWRCVLPGPCPGRRRAGAGGGGGPGGGPGQPGLRGAGHPTSHPPGGPGRGEAQR
ncbi:MAG: hypothetical protein IPG97_14880 [Microthrixaceae bacterium]|nr:hypothetical protein [Microthrixaceae bacterium]